MPEVWYIHQLADETCTVTPQPELAGTMQTWGPFDQASEAIARRVGLIRSGKCKPQQAS